MLKTVRVPAEIEPIFAAAEEAVSRFFRSRKDDPEHGTIEILGERYILVRAASLSVEFFGLVEQLFGPGRENAADQFARNILFDLAHALGKSDARSFHGKMNLESPLAKLSAGPVIFSHTGWAFVDILPESRPLPNDDYYLIFDHPYSCESDAWLRAGKTRDFPVCIMNAGWSSGWCEQSFGVQVVSVEVMCRAKGDETCRFIMAPPKRIERYARAFDAARAGAPRAGGAYEIPDFFARKRAEEELRSLYFTAGGSPSATPPKAVRSLPSSFPFWRRRASWSLRPLRPRGSRRPSPSRRRWFASARSSRSPAWPMTRRSC